MWASQAHLPCCRHALAQGRVARGQRGIVDRQGRCIETSYSASGVAPSSSHRPVDEGGQRSSLNPSREVLVAESMAVIPCLSGDALWAMDVWWRAARDDSVEGGIWTREPVISKVLCVSSGAPRCASLNLRDVGPRVAHPLSEGAKEAGLAFIPAHQDTLTLTRSKARLDQVAAQVGQCGPWCRVCRLGFHTKAMPRGASRWKERSPLRSVCSSSGRGGSRGRLQGTRLQRASCGPPSCA